MTEPADEVEPNTHHGHAEPVIHDEDVADIALTPDEQRQSQWSLDDPDDTDDVPWTPPDRRPLGAEFADLGHEESIENRLRQEIPEQGTAYGAPSPGGEAADQPGRVEMIGGDDPAAIPADEDWLGDTD